MLINNSSSLLPCACFSNRLDGNMSLFYGNTQNSLAAREEFLSRNKTYFKDLVCAKQIHAANIYFARSKDRGAGAAEYTSAIDDTDAFITNEKNVPIAILTADCLSVFFFDPINKAIGLAHAGWRSSSLGIVIRLVERMKQEFKSQSSDLLVKLGPCIRDCCYEVNQGFKNNFTSGFSTKNGKLFFDLPAVNKKQLIACGVLEKNVEDCNICTVCQIDKYFSFRKEGESAGRIISVMML